MLFKLKHAKQATIMLSELKRAARANENVFAVLMDAVKVCSLGQLTDAFYQVGGRYRRNM